MMVALVEFCYKSRAEAKKMKVGGPLATGIDSCQCPRFVYDSVSHKELSPSRHSLSVIEDQGSAST